MTSIAEKYILEKYLNDCDGDINLCLSLYKKEAEAFDAGFEKGKQYNEMITSDALVRES